MPHRHPSFPGAKAREYACSGLCLPVALVLCGPITIHSIRMPSSVLVIWSNGPNMRDFHVSLLHGIVNKRATERVTLQSNHDLRLNIITLGFALIAVAPNHDTVPILYAPESGIFTFSLLHQRGSLSCRTQVSKLIPLELIWKESVGTEVEAKIC